MSVGDLVYSGFLALLLWMIGSCLWHERRTKISPVPVLPWVYGQVIRALEGIVDPGKPINIADLGSGWGGPLKKMARQFPNAQVTGYELSPWPFVISRLRTCFMRRRIRILQQDFFDTDLAQYDLIFCYLSPYHMEQLKPHLQTMKPGSIIVSCSFEIPDWTAVRCDTVRSFVEIPVYVYRV